LLDEQGTGKEKDMNWRRAFILLLFALGVGLTSSTAGAQQSAPKKLLLPCCECLGRSVQLDLSTGVAPWTVSPGAGPTPTTLSAWTASASPAKWIQPVSPATATATSNLPANTTYHYQVAFTVPDNCTIPYDHVELAGKWAADNDGKVNLGPPISNISNCTTGNCFGAPIAFSVASVNVGSHALTVDVTNRSLYSGLLVNAVLTGHCTKNMHR
jgi:hypothetical protein